MINVYVNSNNSLAETQTNFDTNWMKNRSINNTEQELIWQHWSLTEVIKISQCLAMQQTQSMTDTVKVHSVFIF